MDNLSLTCLAGTWTAVLGPSGSDKSTLPHCAAGLDKITSGRALPADRDITDASDTVLTELRRRVIGRVFQSLNLIGPLTAEQNVAFPSKMARVRVSRAQVRQALTDVGLGDRAMHKPREMAGGQQQRVAIARAMISRLSALFADEPTGALDSTSAKIVLELLRRLVWEAGQSIVMVTHDPAVAASADTVVFLSDGHLVDRLDRPTTSLVAERLARWGC
ncbi:ABC transporter ATP-binding protein [Actinosynnema sp. NPDC047251]|uniref:ABC-type transporter n=1 Tax=Saccharothrix espanaensis (strain ATCC 51144 / DSM 44229 / JCM 9112 / NBRC 15066 / NRRL 15764) TaxID=1179773 RepID=K0K7D6_SACES|nr:ABC transporter ATP-binding protein [Saccharothrix espanaensis]CCH32804.1 ABC-type transporter [Saccharothrix espanaensis DSM 44229]